MNRRPDDECQRACGVYRSVDEGQQVQNSGDWDLVIAVDGGDCDCDSDSAVQKFKICTIFYVFNGGSYAHQGCIYLIKNTENILRKS